MAKHVLTILILFLLIFLICGCPYNSSVPISAVENAQINDSLFGDWFTTNNENDSSEVLKVYLLNKHEYLFLLCDKKEINVFRAYPTRIEDYHFLNISEINLESSLQPAYIFAEYKLIGDELRIRLIEDELFKTKMENSNDLYHFIKSNLKNQQLFGEVELLVRRVR